MLQNAGNIFFSDEHKNRALYTVVIGAATGNHEIQCTRHIVQHKWKL